jgi:hypothetical protein
MFLYSMSQRGPSRSSSFPHLLFQSANIADAEESLSVAYSSWDSLSKSLSSLPSSSQTLQNIEKWLIEFDPSFTEPTTPFQLQQLIRIKQTHSISFQLHSHHSLLIHAHQLYLKILEATSTANPMKILQGYQRLYEIIKTVCPDMTSERIDFEKKYSETINGLLSRIGNSAAVKKAVQVSESISSLLIGWC